MRVLASVAAATFLMVESAVPQQPVTACSLLTRELAMQFSSAANKVVFDFPPEPETLAAGTACEYGDIRLQIDPYSAEQVKQLPASGEQGWAAVAGVGDGAYFRNNGDTYAELAGWVGTRTFTLQLGVPFQGSAEGIKPNVVGLANAIAAKLR